MGDVEFIQGIRVYAPRETAPDYIIANCVIDADALGQFLAAHPGQTRVVIKRSKGGKYYAQVDTYKRDGAQQRPQRQAQQPERVPVPSDADFDDTIPF